MEKNNVMNRIRNTTVLLLALVLFAGAAYDASAQDEMVLTLEDAMRIALTQSYTIKKQINQFEQQQLQLELTKANQKTKTTLNWDIPKYNQSINEVETATGSVYNNDKSFKTNASLNISQPVRWTNGDLSFGVNYSTMNQYTLYDENTTENHKWTDAFSLNYSQPLFQPNTKMMEWNHNKRSFELAEKSYEETENNVWLTVMKDFYNLYKAKRSLEIAQLDFDNKERNLDITDNKYQTGMLAEVDKMQAELDLSDAQNSLEEQKLNFKRQKDSFKRTIGLPLEQEIDVTVEIDVKFVEIVEQKAIEEAFKHSVSMLSQEYSLIDQKDNIKITEAQDKIKAQLNMTYGLNEQDPFGQLWKGEWDWSKGLMKDYTQSNSVSLSLIIPVWDSGRRKITIEKSQLSINSSKDALENFKLDLQKQVQTNIDEIANARVRITQQAGNVVIAETNYTISVERFNAGDIDNNALFLQSQKLTNAMENELNAQIDYLLALASLYKLTFWDFENNCMLNETVKKFIDKY